MKKDFMSYLALGIVFELSNTIAFVIPIEKTATEKSTYIRSYYLA